MSFDISEQLKLLPEAPGVYLMYDKNDKIIYVGKAKILKNRVRQYFQNNIDSVKTIAMVRNIAYFEYIITDSEIEALVLENTLIKKHKPRYNILLKDDKSYPYIKVSINEEYPRLIVTRRLENDHAKYFGPYSSMQTVKTTIELVKKIFNPPTCKRRFPQDIQKGRPCLNYSIKRCFGACTGRFTKEEYRKVFYDICAFLDGKNDELINSLTNDMQQSSEKLEFEKAGDLRNKIFAIQALNETQKIIDTSSRVDKDVIALELYDDMAFVALFFVRKSRIVGKESYTMTVGEDSGIQKVLTSFMEQYYSKEGVYIPKEFYLQHQPNDFELLGDWLSTKRGNKVEIFVPKRGEKLDLVNMVKKNVTQAVGEYEIDRLSKEREADVLKKLAKNLAIDVIPKRIEAYDISNIQGVDNVGAMVVFDNGKKITKEYRKFKIKYVDGADDYQSMQEMIYRRFTHSAEENQLIRDGKLDKDKARFTTLPDLILIDGGLAHLNVALDILNGLNITIPTFGMVKDDKHKTRGLVGKDGEIGLSPTSSVFNLIGRIQDEVHNTAINYYRQLHRNRLSMSELDGINRVGKAKKQILLRHFKTIAKIKEATLEQLIEIKGIDKTTAKNIYEYFRG